MAGNVVLKRIYEAPATSDGYRVLVDRLWPRGVKKEDAFVDEWMKDVAPSPELRKWFSHKPERFDEFRKRYVEELTRSPEKVVALERLKDLVREKSRVTLLFAAKDETHNHVVVLKQTLEE